MLFLCISDINHLQLFMHRYNVIFVGRSNSGKSTLVKALSDPFVSTTARGFSQTRSPQCYNVKIFKTSDESLDLNIIDTVGLQDVEADMPQTKSDDAIFNELECFLQNNMNEIDCVCFISPAGQTHRLDIACFERLTKFFGPNFSSKSMMILSHCDSYSDSKLSEFVENLKSHPLSKPFVDYCKLGIHCHGIVNYDELALYEADPSLRNFILDRQRERITSMNQTLINALSAALQTVLDKQTINQQSTSSGMSSHQLSQYAVVNSEQTPVINHYDNKCCTNLHKVCCWSRCCHICLSCLAIGCILAYVTSGNFFIN